MDSMVSSSPTSALTALLGGETKARILRVLLADPQASFHLRGLANAAGVDSGNAHKTLKMLASADLVRVDPDSRGSVYRLESASPLAAPLRALFFAAGELLDDLRAVARELDAECVLVYGSAAQGQDGPGSDVDVLVIGGASAIEAQAAFAPVSRKHGRRIEVLTIERRQIERELSEHSEFWRGLFAGRTITLKGEASIAALLSAARG
jgi:predicted nucleotidyltransferase